MCLDARPQCRMAGISRRAKERTCLRRDRTSAHRRRPRPPLGVSPTAAASVASPWPAAAMGRSFRWSRRGDRLPPANDDGAEDCATGRLPPVVAAAAAAAAAAEPPTVPGLRLPVVRRPAPPAPAAPPVPVAGAMSGGKTTPRGSGASGLAVAEIGMNAGPSRPERRADTDKASWSTSGLIGPVGGENCGGESPAGLSRIACKPGPCPCPCPGPARVPASFPVPVPVSALLSAPLNDRRPEYRRTEEEDIRKEPLPPSPRFARRGEAAARRAPPAAEEGSGGDRHTTAAPSTRKTSLARVVRATIMGGDGDVYFVYVMARRYVCVCRGWRAQGRAGQGGCAGWQGIQVCPCEGRRAHLSGSFPSWMMYLSLSTNREDIICSRNRRTLPVRVGGGGGEARERPEGGVGVVGRRGRDQREGWGWGRERPGGGSDQG